MIESVIIHLLVVAIGFAVGWALAELLFGQR